MLNSYGRGMGDSIGIIIARMDIAIKNPSMGKEMCV